MKRIFILSTALLFCSGTIQTGNTRTNTDHIPTIVDRIHELRNLAIEPSPSVFLRNVHSSNVNTCDEHGWTLLSCALNQEFASIVRELIQRGASASEALVSAIDHDNTAALTALINFLGQIGQSIDLAMTADGRTSLSYAMLANSTGCIELLKHRGALLKNAFKACIQKRNSPLFIALANKAGQQETNPILQEMVLESLSEASLEQFSTIKKVIGTHNTLLFLNSIDEESILLQPVRNRLTSMRKQTTLDLALEQDNPQAFNNAWQNMPGTISSHPWHLLQQAIAHEAVNTVAEMATMGLVTLKMLQPLIASRGENTQHEIAHYVQTYLALHIDTESQETIRSLYHLVRNRQLGTLAQEMLAWVMAKETDVCIETNNQKQLATALTSLDNQEIHISRITLLSQAVRAGATNIITWLAEQGFRLGLDHAIELLDAENFRYVQQYLKYVITDVISMSIESSQVTLRTLKCALKPKIDNLNIDELSTWYTTMVAPLISERLEPF